MASKDSAVRAWRFANHPSVVRSTARSWGQRRRGGRDPRPTRVSVSSRRSSARLGRFCCICAAELRAVGANRASSASRRSPIGCSFSSSGQVVWHSARGIEVLETTTDGHSSAVVMSREPMQLVDVRWSDNGTAILAIDSARRLSLWRETKGGWTSEAIRDGHNGPRDAAFMPDGGVAAVESGELVICLCPGRMDPDDHRQTRVRSCGGDHGVSRRWPHCRERGRWRRGLEARRERALATFHRDPRWTIIRRGSSSPATASCS